MKIKFTLDIPDNWINKEGQVFSKSTDELERKKDAARMWFYEMSNDEMLYNCNSEDIEIIEEKS